MVKFEQKPLRFNLSHRSHSSNSDKLKYDKYICSTSTQFLYKFEDVSEKMRAKFQIARFFFFAYPDQYLENIWICNPECPN